MMNEVVSGQQCRFCGSRLKGRIDKKFCNDSCRTMYHNHQSVAPMHVREINQVLMQNRRIILDLLGENKLIKIRRNELIAQGFNPRFFTETRLQSDSSVIHYCYESGFMEIGSSSFLLFVESTG